MLEQLTIVIRNGGTVAFHRAVLGPEGNVRGYATAEFVDGRIRLYVAERPVLDLLETGILSPDTEGTLDVVPGEGEDPDDVIFKACLVHVDRGQSRQPEVNLRLTSQPACQLDVISCDFGVSVALLDMPGDMLKSEHGAIPPDARWITVHPHGAGSKGQPVLVVPADEAGTMRVIGGAGGKLNMLKLRGVRSESSYRQEAGERADAKRKARKDQIVRDKELGVHDAKVEAHKKVQDARRTAQDKFFGEVAEALGWDMSQLELDTSELTQKASKKAICGPGRFIFQWREASKTHVSARDREVITV